MKEQSKLPFSKIPRGIFLAALVMYTLLICFIMLEFATVTREMGATSHFLSFPLDNLFLNILTLGALLAALWILCNRLWLACLLLNILCFVISVANYFVLMYHGMPLSFQLLRNALTALNVISSYDLSIDRAVILLILAFLTVTAACLLVRRFVPQEKLSWKRILLRDGILAVLCCLVMYFGYFSDHPVKPKKTIGWLWSEAYFRYGYTACTVESFCNLFQVANQPEGYSQEAVQAIEIGAPQGEDSAAPDVILILNESFYDLSLITDLEADVDYLANIRAMDNVLRGYAVVPSAGGGTNSSEYELLTGNSLYLMPGITPFNSLNLNNANSVVSHMNALGYVTTGSHSEPGANYSRTSGYAALGFGNVHFESDFQNISYYFDRWYESDESLYQNLIRWYEEDPEDVPRFHYLLTIQNHGAWDRNDPRYDTVHAAEDFGEYDDDVDEFLTCISQSDQAFRDLTDYFSQVNRPVIICMMGDHSPTFASSIADPSLSEEERNILLRSVPLYIWANFPLEQQELGTMSMNYVVPTLLDIAGMKLSPYYSYMLQLKEQVPILTAYGSYYDREGNLYSYDEDAGLAYARAVDSYFYLEYHNLQQNRDQKLYDPWP